LVFMDTTKTEGTELDVQSLWSPKLVAGGLEPMNDPSCVTAVGQCATDVSLLCDLIRKVDVEQVENSSEIVRLVFRGGATWRSS